MASSAPAPSANILAFPPAKAPLPARTADRRQVIEYESGHVWRVNRAHVERVLDAKAAAMMDAPVKLEG